MKAKYYDPLFYISSEKMPFTVRIEIKLKETVLEQPLQYAVSKAMERYPYFALRLAERDGEVLAEPNEKPVVVYPGPTVYPLGSEKVNRHLLALSYYEKGICFYISHVITDGGGFVPFVKTVLYYYLCDRYQVELDPDGINLAGEPFFEDELGNPYPEEKMKAAKPFCKKELPDFFRLRDGGYVCDREATVYRLRLKESEVMKFNYDNDGSPCSLISVLMTKAIWSLHPNEKKDIVSAVSFNLRPGLGNRHNYRMLSSAILLDYPEKMRNTGVTQMCTCSRGMTMLQSQAENVIYYAAQQKKRVEELLTVSGTEEKKRLCGEMALRDSTENTFSVSYVGRIGFGSAEPYMDSMYNLTDGSTYETVFIEVAAINGIFYLAFIQGFSSDIYYRSFLEQLKLCGLSYEEGAVTRLNTPEMAWPGEEKPGLAGNAENKKE